MVDDQALRARRARRHRMGDHSLCKRDRCAALRAGVPVELPTAGEGLELVSAYRCALEDAGRLGSPEGVTVMHLATLLAEGKHTAAGAASLSRELRAAMEIALRGAPRQADALDELAARRDRKTFGA